MALRLITLEYFGHYLRHRYLILLYHAEIMLILGEEIRESGRWVEDEKKALIGSTMIAKHHRQEHRQ